MRIYDVIPFAILCGDEMFVEFGLVWPPFVVNLMYTQT